MTLGVGDVLVAVAEGLIELLEVGAVSSNGG